MATKTFYATGAFRYGTRMLKAGDAVELDAPNARLFTALKKISPTAPKKDAVPAMTTENVVKPAAAPTPKKAPRKRKAAAKK